MAVTTLLHDASAFVFSGSAGGAGSWTNVAAVGAVGAVNYKMSTVVGDKVTITWTGRALYLYTMQDSLGCDFTVTTDGVTRNSFDTCNERTPVGSDLGFYRVPILIESGLAEGNHTTVIQSTYTGIDGRTYSRIYINGAVVVSGAKIQALPNTNILNALGDSWTFGAGALTYSHAYINVLRNMWAKITKKTWTLNNRGLSGSGLVTRSTNNLLTAMEQIVLSVADNPNIITLLYGVNCIRLGGNGLSAAQFQAYYRTTLQFLEDVFDVTKVKVFLGTPGYITSFYTYDMLQSSGNMPSGWNYNQGDYEHAVQLVRDLADEFPYTNLVDVYTAMDRDSSLVLPSSAADNGLHPNNPGHMLLAVVFVKAFKKVFKIA